MRIAGIIVSIVLIVALVGFIAYNVVVIVKTLIERKKHKDENVEIENKD